MTSEDVLQELEREPFVPFRLHLVSGQKVDVSNPNTAWMRQNTMLIVHPLRPGSRTIGNYDVIALRSIERMETLENGAGDTGRRGRRKRQ